VAFFNLKRLKKLSRRTNVAKKRFFRGCLLKKGRFSSLPHALISLVSMRPTTLFVKSGCQSVASSLKREDTKRKKESKLRMVRKMMRDPLPLAKGAVRLKHLPLYHHLPHLPHLRTRPLDPQLLKRRKRKRSMKFLKRSLHPVLPNGVRAGKGPRSQQEALRGLRNLWGLLLLLVGLLQEIPEGLPVILI
jgi:hypothetical protein